MTKYNPPFLILKPKAGTWADQQIAKGSGIVGVVNGEYVHVSYEGNLYRCENLEKWEQRVMHAADRLATGYPTVARGIMPFDEFEPAGYINQDAAGHWFITHPDGTVTVVTGRL
jgi:hypothetical protein